MENNYAFVMIKPDATNHVGAIVNKFEENKFTVCNIVMSMLCYEDICLLYKEHIGKPHFKSHAEFMQSGPVVGIMLSNATYGHDTWATIKRICGVTDPTKADKSSIRGMFGSELPCNAIHSSDSEDLSIAEACILFPAIWSQIRAESSALAESVK